MKIKISWTRTDVKILIYVLALAALILFAGGKAPEFAYMRY